MKDFGVLSVGKIKDRLPPGAGDGAAGFLSIEAGRVVGQ